MDKAFFQQEVIAVIEEGPSKKNFEVFAMDIQLLTQKFVKGTPTEKQPQMKEINELIMWIIKTHPP